MAKGKNPNANVAIEVLGTTQKGVYSTSERRPIQKAIRDSLLLPSMEPYHRVQVEVKTRRDGSPEALVATMLRAFTYTAEIMQVNVDSDYRVKSVATYAGDNETTVAVSKAVSSRTVAGRAKGPDMVFATPVPEIPTAKAAVEYAYQTAKQAGYRVVKLLGKDASVANYQQYLSAHLKAFGNIGHGYTGGIVLSDGRLTSSWFDGLPKKTLSPEVVYFNSCQVFNAPLQPAITKAGARTFVGGKVNLQIGPSEEVFKCFWTSVLTGRKKMGDTLNKCEKKLYPMPGSHGISGDQGVF